MDEDLKLLIKKVNDVMRTTKEGKYIKDLLDCCMCRISNRNDDKYKKYDIIDIFKAKTLKTKKYKFDDRYIILEFVYSNIAPSNVVIIYNGFLFNSKNNFQDEIEMYVLKEK